MANALSIWLRSLDAERIHVHYDYHTDMDLLEMLLAGADLWSLWSGVLVPTHVAYLYGDDRVEAFMQDAVSREESKTGLKAHHALADARILSEVFAMVHDGIGAPT